MADEPSKRPGPFDVKTIEYLVALMSKHDLSEMDLAQGDQRIQLRRGQRVKTATIAAAPLPPPAPPLPASPPLTPATEKPNRNLVEIKSPTIGTFYSQEKEGASHT